MGKMPATSVLRMATLCYHKRANIPILTQVTMISSLHQFTGCAPRDWPNGDPPPQPVAIV